MVTAVCVLRTGKEYEPDHVYSLHVGLWRWWPHKKVPFHFAVLTDQVLADFTTRPLTRPELFGWWAKIEMLAPENAEFGNILYFDLDTKIVGPLDDIVYKAAQPFAKFLLQDFYRPGNINSGVMALSPEVRAEAWAQWKEPRRLMGIHRGDGNWFNSLWQKTASRWQEYLPGQIVSYKAHCRTKGVPRGARVVCFHGRPRPWQIKRLDWEPLT